MRRARPLMGAVTVVALVVLLGSTFGSPPRATPPMAAVSPTPGEATLTPVAVTTPAEIVEEPTPGPTPVPPIFRLPEPEDSISPPMPRATPTPDPDTGSSEGREGRVTVPGDGQATRVVFASLGIDLPVVAGDLRVRRNPSFYPLCDVAQYMIEFGQPGEVGTAYIYAHAQKGMFLPMLRASRRDNGAEMIGARVEVYTSDSKLHIYEVFRVKRRSLNLKIAFNVSRGEHRLILQTSEGPPGHRPVLQVAARPVAVVETTATRAMPEPKPRACPPR